MEQELDLLHYWKILKKRWLLIIIIPIIAALASGLVSLFILKPVYQSATTLIVGKKAADEASQLAAGQLLDNNVLQANQQLAKTYGIIAKSRAVENRVITKLNLDLTTEQLDSKIAVNPVKNTEIIEIAVVDNDPQLAADIANRMAIEFSDAVITIKKVDSVGIIDKAVAPTDPVKPNKKMNVLIAFVVGLMASLGLALLLNFLDNTIKDEKDVEEFLGLPVLGIILNYREAEAELAKSEKIKVSKKRIIIPLIVVLCVVLPSSILWAIGNKAVPTFQTVSANAAIEKVKNAEKQGGTTELSEAEVNSVVHLITDKPDFLSYIKQVDFKLGDNTVELYAQGVLIGGIKFVLYTQGDLSYQDGRLIYTPQKFSAGSIPLPKSLVGQIAAKSASSNIIVSADTVEISKELLPARMVSLAVAKETVKVGFTEGTTVLANDDTVGKSSESVGENKPASSTSVETATTEQQTLADHKKALLQQVSSDLAVVQSLVLTAKEKVIIETMIITVNSLITNPDYDYKSQTAAVLTAYKKLTPEEKTDLKKAMLSNMNLNTALEVKNLFGL